jgi:hypothetical protein
MNMWLSNLRLPFVAEVVCRRGACLIGSGRYIHSLEQGGSFRLSAHRTFHLGLHCATSVGKGSTLHITLSEGPDLSGEVQGVAANLAFEGATRIAGPLTQQLAKAIFIAPQAPWSRAYAAAVLGLSMPRLSAQMLREGRALTDIILEQRLMRALVAVSLHGEAASAFGLATQERLYAAFFDRFGDCAEHFATGRWCGALSWAGAPLGKLMEPSIKVANLRGW